MWFYDVDADGRSLDDKRTPLLPEEKLGSNPRQALAPDEHAKNNLPDVLARWHDRAKRERDNPRTAQSFCVPAKYDDLTRARKRAGRGHGVGRRLTRRDHLK